MVLALMEFVAIGQTQKQKLTKELSQPKALGNRMTEAGRVPPRSSSSSSSFYVRKLRPREVKWLAQGHTVGKWQSQDSDAGTALIVVIGDGGRRCQHFRYQPTHRAVVCACAMYTQHKGV